MLTSSKKQKGKKLEKEVANAFKDIYAFAYSRADSGSGLHYKEDVSLPNNAPFHIECKNHATPAVNTWWQQTLEGCPENKIPVLIYRLNFQKGQTVVIRLNDLNNYIYGAYSTLYPVLITLEFSDFIEIVRERENQIKSAIV